MIKLAVEDDEYAAVGGFMWECASGGLSSERRDKSHSRFRPGEWIHPRNLRRLTVIGKTFLSEILACPWTRLVECSVFDDEAAWIRLSVGGESRRKAIGNGR